MRSFSLSSSVSSSLSSSWRGSSSSSKKTFKKKTNRCRQSRNFTKSVSASSLKNDENDDDQTTTPVGMVVVKEEAKEKTNSIKSSKVDFAMPNRLLSSENLTTVSRFLPKSESSRILNFFCQKGCLSFFSQNSPKHLLKQQQTG